MTSTETGRSGAGRSSSLSDLGLLVLRIAIGASMLQGGLIKALDFGSTTAFMESGGWRMSTFAAYMVTAAEVVGGVGLLLGLLTPIAACAVIAAMMDAWAVNVSGVAFWSDPFNVPFLVAFGATTLLLTGAGGFSVDARVLGRARWPSAVTVGLFVVAVAAAVATWVLLNGINPIHLTDPAG
jgi:putative oxidoreductase